MSTPEIPPIAPYPRQPVACQEYNPRSPDVAQLVANLIQTRLAGVAVEHIGSTAVAGCAGRGAIDLLVLYSGGLIDPVMEGLDALGFQWVQRHNALPGQWPKGAGAVEYQGELFRLHIHVLPADHPVIAELRLFRDRLRADPQLLAAYVARKRDIIASGVTDPIAYTSAKETFVLAAIERLHHMGET
jgi:GrpB-like predicted nucleotidyltransferase (UPF0157 family)